MTVGRRQWLRHGAWTLGTFAGLAPRLSYAAAEASAFALVLSRARSDYLAEGGPGEVAKWLASQRGDGTWADVVYQHDGMGDWLPMRHLERLRRVARALAEPGAAAIQAPAGQQTLERGVLAWLRLRPQSKNWWFNSIGQQRELMRILVLGGHYLNAQTLQQATALLHDPSMVPAAQATGQNLTWYAAQQVLRGALARQAADIEAARLAVSSTLNTTLDEGVQPDGSFHQHGPQLYSGGYGLGFLQDNTQIAAWLAGTPWRLPASALDLLCHYALEGVVPLVRGQAWLDWSARGREFTRAETVPRSRLVQQALARLAAMTAAHQGALEAATLRLRLGNPPSSTSNRHYWRSDFVVHHGPAGYCSVKMCSDRTVGTEAGNGENLLGYWLPFGVTYLLRRGDEYEGLPAVWDWSALPGLTAPAEVPVLQGYQRHQSAFVGAVSDGRAGVAAMRLDKLQTKAMKAWFIEGERMVALAAGITSSRPNPVRTTVNQTRWVGPVHTDQGLWHAQGADMPVAQPGWIWMDGVAYALLDVPDVRLGLESRSASPDRINRALQGTSNVSQPVFQLCLNHGTRPQGGRCAYAVQWGVDTPGAVAAIQWPEVLANTEALQAVRHAGGLVQAVFHQAGRLPLDATRQLAVDAPCLVQARQVKGGWQCLFAEPTGQRTSLKAVVLSQDDRPIASQSFTFERGGAVVRQQSWEVPAGPR